MMNRFLRYAGLALALAGCAGPIRPTVRPTVGLVQTSLPDQPEQREEVLASAAARPGPETRRSSAAKLEEETAAATLAAVLGTIFSTGDNTFIGFVVSLGKGRPVAPQPDAGRGQQQ